MGRVCAYRLRSMVREVYQAIPTGLYRNIARASRRDTLDKIRMTNLTLLKSSDRFPLKKMKQPIYQSNEPTVPHDVADGTSPRLSRLQRVGQKIDTEQGSKSYGIQLPSIIIGTHDMQNSNVFCRSGIRVAGQRRTYSQSTENVTPSSICQVYQPHNLETAKKSLTRIKNYKHGL